MSSDLEMNGGTPIDGPGDVRETKSAGGPRDIGDTEARFDSPRSHAVSSASASDVASPAGADGAVLRSAMEKAVAAGLDDEAVLRSSLEAHLQDEFGPLASPDMVEATMRTIADDEQVSAYFTGLLASIREESGPGGAR